MKKNKISLLPVLLLITSLIAAPFSVNPTYATHYVPPAPLEKTWYPGEGLKKGDFFEYKICNECVDSQILRIWIGIEFKDYWIAKMEIENELEETFLKIAKDDLSLIDVESENESLLHNTYEDGVNRFTSYIKEEKSFSAYSWGKIVNTGAQLLTNNIAKYTVQAGSFDDTIKLKWSTGEALIADNIPFPIKVSDSQFFDVELINYEQGVYFDQPELIKNPFSISINQIFYDQGEVIVISGTGDATFSLKNYLEGVELKSSQTPVTFRIISSTGNLVEFIQEYVLEDGTFSIEIFTDGKFWNDPGLYTLKANHGSEELIKKFWYKFDGGKIPEPESIPSKKSSLADFVDPEKDSQYYVDRYNNEIEYKEWFGTFYPQYSSIYEAVGLPESTTQKIPDWVKNTMQWYLDGTVSEQEMLNALQFLIKEGILMVD